MPDKRSSQVSLSAIRILFLSSFGAMLILEICLALLTLRYNTIQNGILADQSRLLRTREILSDALRDAQAAWKTGHDENFIKSQEPETLPESAVRASDSIKILRKLQRPSLIFPFSDLDRLEDIVANNVKLLGVNPPFNAEQKALRAKTDLGFTSFLAAIDIRLFSSMQEFRREVEYLEMVIWGLIPLLILSTAIFGIILLSKVMQPLAFLKKQSRKLIDNLAVLQHELRIAQAEAASNAVVPEPVHKPSLPTVKSVAQVSAESITSTNLPPQSIPPQSIPPQSMPPQSMPPQLMPPQSMPPQSMPPQSMPPQSMPPQSMSPQSMPPQSMPPQSMPPQSMPPQPSPPPMVVTDEPLRTL